jgi:hypothetical protein
MKKPVVLAVVAVVLAPILVDVVLFMMQATSYAGMCDGHAPDIQARPCGYTEYLIDGIADPFVLVALFMIDALVLVVTGLLAGVVLAVVLCVRDLNAPQPHAKWRAGDLRHRAG